MHKKYLYMLTGGSALVAAGYAFGTPLDHVLDMIQALPHLDDMGVIGAMAVVQGSYSERIAAASPGQIANMSSYDVDSRSVENSNGIPFGRACGRGVADKGVVLGSTLITDFVGISVRDVTLAPESFDSDYVDEYRQYALAGILTRGDIWVQVGGAVADGEDVRYVALTGVLSTAGGLGPISGARWMTSAAINGLAIVRLSGYQQSV